MRKINVRFFLSLVAGVVIVSGVVAAVHRFQYSRIAQSVLWQAERAEEQDNPDRAFRYLQRYLEFAPHDLDRKAQLARLLASDRFAGSRKARNEAVRLLDEVLTADRDRQDVRRLVVKLALETRQLKLARDRLQELWTHAQSASSELTAAQRGELRMWWGQLLEAENRPAEAVSWYEKAVEDAPGEITPSIQLARLLRRQSDGDEKQRVEQGKTADRIVDRLVQAAPDNSQTYLARWRYRREFDLFRTGGLIDPLKFEDAAADVRTALDKAPDNVEVLLAAADCARLGGNVADADRKRDAAQRKRAVAEARDRARAYLQTGLDLVEKQPATAARQDAEFQLLWHLTNLILDAQGPRQADEAASAIARLEKTNASPAAIDYLQGRVCFNDKRWAEAAALFERARPLCSNLADLATQIDLHLGQCYEQLDEASLMFAAYQRIQERDPDSVLARLGMGTAQWMLGRLDEALTHYQQVMAAKDVPAKGWLDVARLEIQRQQQVESDKRDWKLAEQALSRSGSDPGQAVEQALIRAELLSAQGKPVEADAALLAARDGQVDEVKLWAAKADLAARRQDWAAAQAALDAAEKDERVKGHVELRLAAVRLIAARKADDASDQLKKIEAGADRYAVEDQSRLLSAVAEAQLRIGKVDEARRVWAEVAKTPRHKTDLRLRLLLFDLALKGGAAADVEAALEDVRAVEGRQGTASRHCQSLRLIWLARQARKTPDRAERSARDYLDQARIELDKVAKERPAWPPLFLARADVEEASGNPEQAIAHYRRAIELGENSQAVVQRLVVLLYQRQRYEDAAQELKRLKDSMRSTPEMNRVAAAVALGKNDPTKAVTLADAAIAADSTNYRDHLWHGQLLALAGKPAEAEAKLRRAVELGGAEPETWVNLIQYLWANGKTDLAKAELTKAGERLGEKAPLALGQCYEVMGQRDEARRQYELALNQRKTDATVVRSVAGFHLRAGNGQAALPLLRTLVDRQIKAEDADVEWARRGLAMVLAGGPGQKQVREALELVGIRPDENGQLARPDARELVEAPAELLRVRARVLATQPLKPYRERAVELFEALDKRQALAAEDRYLLAQLYESAGKMHDARARMLKLIADEPNNPQYLGQFVHMLIRMSEWKEAATRLEKLETLEKGRPGGQVSYPTVELRARLFEAKQQGDEALKVLQAYVTRPGARKEESLVLVGSLVRQKRYEDALARCEQAWKECPPEVVGGVSVAVLRSMQATEEPCRRVEGWIQAKLQEKLSAKETIALRMHLADLYDLRGRYADAEAEYRRVLQQDPGNVVALNNLAWLMATRAGDGPQALALINKAIDATGKRADLLDTRGLVHLAMGKTEEAVSDLQEAISDTPTATRWFHLARAHYQAKDRDSAARVLSKATQLGLQPAALHPTEQPTCRQMLAELKPR